MTSKIEVSINDAHRLWFAALMSLVHKPENKTKQKTLDALDRIAEAVFEATGEMLPERELRE